MTNEKFTLNFKEAAEYFGIGENKLRSLAKDPDCQFALHIGNRTRIKKDVLAEVILNSNVL